MSQLKAVVVGDAMIMGDAFLQAAKKNIGDKFSTVEMGNWEEDYPKLQERRLAVEKQMSVPGVPKVKSLCTTDGPSCGPRCCRN